MVDNEDGDPSEGVKQYVTENTYILEPEGYGEAFVWKHEKLQKVISHVLEQRLTGLTYDPVKSAQSSKQLADDVKEQIKALGCQRHKLVVQVTLQQKKGQQVRATSRCLWDPHADAVTHAYYDSETMYCICAVYGLFVE